MNMANGVLNEDDIEDVRDMKNEKKESGKRSSKKHRDKSNNRDDENLEFLHHLRNCVHPERVKLIDKMIELYMNGGFNDI